MKETAKLLYELVRDASTFEIAMMILLAPLGWMAFRNLPDEPDDHEKIKAAKRRSANINHWSELKDDTE